MMNFFSFFLSPFPCFSPQLVLVYTFLSTFFHWNQIHTSKIVTTKGTLIRKTEPPRSGQNELFTKFWQLYGSAFNDWDKIRRPDIRTSLLRMEKKELLAFSKNLLKQLDWTFFNICLVFIHNKRSYCFAETHPVWMPANRKEFWSCGHLPWIAERALLSVVLRGFRLTLGEPNKGVLQTTDVHFSMPYT